MAGKKHSVNEDNNDYSYKKRKRGKIKERRENLSWTLQEPVEENLNNPREWNGTTWNFCSPEIGGKCNPGQYRVDKPIKCKGEAKCTEKGHTGSKLLVKQKKYKKVVIKEAVETMEGGHASE